jgi:hypothetical protein
MSLAPLNRFFPYSFRRIDLASRYGGAVYALPRSNPDHLLAGDFSNIGCAISIYFFGIWQRKPAIGLLTYQWSDRARGFRVDSEIFMINPVTGRPDDW